ncbi:MAG: HD domain-containing phosphohydrolase [Bacillota bacterium]
MFRQYSPALRKALTALSGLTVLLLAVALPRLDPTRFWALVFLFFTGILMSQIPSSPRLRGVVTALVDTLAVLVVGTWPALYVAALGRLASALLDPGHDHAHIPLPVAAEQVAAGTLATLAYGLMLDSLLPVVEPLEAMFLSVIGYTLVRGLVHALVEMERFRLRPLTAWRRQLLYVSGYHASGALSGVVLRAFYPAGGLPVEAMVVFVLFSLLALYSAWLVARRQIAYRDALYGLIHAIENKKGSFDAAALDVADLSAAIGCKLGLDDAGITTLYLGGLLRDIGMVAVPETAFNRPGPLTEEEIAAVRRHTGSGEGIARRVPYLKTCIPIIRHHHELCDGSGYPDGLAGNEIPLAARVVGLVDGYCALTSQRPYRPRLLPRDALRELRSNAAHQFDPHLLSLLGQAVEERERWGKIVFRSHYSFGASSTRKEGKHHPARRTHL